MAESKRICGRGTRSIPLVTLHQLSGSPGHDLPIVEELESAFERVPHNACSPHSHDYYEVFIVGGGNAFLQVELGEYRINGPGVCLFPPGAIHAWGSGTKLSGHVLRIPMCALNHDAGAPLAGTSALIRAARVIPLDRETMTRIETLSSWLFLEANSNSSNRAEIMRAQLELLLIELTRAARPPEASDLEVTDVAVFTHFLELVEKHFRERWAVPEYATQLRVGRTRLARAVRQALDKTPAQVIQGRLVAEASRLIAHTDMRLGQISDELGFPSQAYFCRVFRQVKGLAPSDFRTNAKKDKKQGTSDKGA